MWGVPGQPEANVVCVAGDAAGDREQPQAQTLGFPPAGVFGVEGEHLRPGGQLGRQLHDLHPHPAVAFADSGG